MVGKLRAFSAIGVITALIFGNQSQPAWASEKESASAASISDGADPEIEGGYWQQNPRGVLSYVEIVKTKDGKYEATIKYLDGQNVDYWHFTAREVFPGIFYAPSTIYANRMAIDVPVLLMQSRKGTWISVDIWRDLPDSPIKGARMEHLRKVALKYGYTLPEESPRYGNIFTLIDPETLGSLLADPAFLGALPFMGKDIDRLLPADSRSRPNLYYRDEGGGDDGPHGGHLSTSAFPIPSDKVRASPNLSGRFLLCGYYFGTSLHDEEFGTITQERNGAFSITNDSDESELLWIIDIGQPDRYLAMIHHFHNGADMESLTDGEFAYYILDIAENRSLKLMPVILFNNVYVKTANVLSQPMDRVARQNLAQAAHRYGLRITGDTVEGAVNPETMRDLFLDPQFQAGLLLNKDDNYTMRLHPIPDNKVSGGQVGCEIEKP